MIETKQTKEPRIHFKPLKKEKAFLVPKKSKCRYYEVEDSTHDVIVLVNPQAFNVKKEEYEKYGKTKRQAP